MAASKPNIAELIKLMPATDRELEAQRAATQEPADPARKAQPKSGRDPQASKFTGPAPELTDKICQELMASGPPSILELIQAVREPGDPDFENYKAGYLLHCLVLYVGRADQQAGRKMLLDILLSQACNPRLAQSVRGFLVREIQWLGDKSATAALGSLLPDEAFCADAAAALVTIGAGAVEQFRQAATKASGKCRLIVLQNLGVLRDEQSAGLMRNTLQDTDVEARLIAGWALARMADPNAVDLLLKAAEVPVSFERTKATQSCLLLAESLLAAGKKAEAVKIYNHLRTTRTDPKEQYIRATATQALEKMTGKLS